MFFNTIKCQHGGNNMHTGVCRYIIPPLAMMSGKVKRPGTLLIYCKRVTTHPILRTAKMLALGVPCFHKQRPCGVDGCIITLAGRKHGEYILVLSLRMLIAHCLCCSSKQSFTMKNLDIYFNWTGTKQSSM